MADDIVDLERLQAHIDRVRASETFSRAEMMRRLFDFLAQRSLFGKTPKEIEIAIDVFGKDASFAVVQSAMVRVNIHKLRRRLAEHYAEAEFTDGWRLTIPRGEYRLVLECVPAPLGAGDAVVAPQIESPPSPPERIETEPAPFDRRRWMLGGVALLLIANVLVWFALRPQASPSMRDITTVRAHPIWRDINDDNLPVYVAVGDYYIFGELDDSSMNLRRLVREFDINSRNDLERFLKSNPQLAERYMDVSLQYLPISAGYALLNIFPLLEPNTKRSRQVQVIMASDLTPAIVKSSHIIYIGLLSGLGILRDLAFTGSQFEIGDSYDELVDRETGEHYVSQASASVDSRTLYRDYGYFSTAVTPSGNRIVIVAGTRDVAAIHAAEAVTHSQSLAQLIKQAGMTANFEALYAVEAIDRTNLDGRLLITGKLSLEATE